MNKQNKTNTENICKAEWTVLTHSRFQTVGKFKRQDSLKRSVREQFPRKKKENAEPQARSMSA